MDRFEAGRQEKIISIAKIYIPVWIDLKHLPQNKLQ